MSILFLIIAIFLCISLAIFPKRVGKITLNMATAPLLVLILLLVLGIIDHTTVIDGIVGNEHIQPWQILTIFFTVAYVSVSADRTGIFDYFAYTIVHKSKGNGNLLFLFLFLFSAALTVVTSNDIVILTLTPIIFYLSTHAHINVVPLLFAQFFVANTASMYLFTGDPTNIIIGNALNIPFWEFTKAMYIAASVALVANYIALKTVFKKNITKKFTLKKESSYTISSWLDALVGFAILLVMLITLTLSDSLPVSIWQITLLYACIALGKDIIMNTKGTHFAENVLHIPWKIFPFVGTFFILVHALFLAGVTDIIAESYASMITGVGSAIALIGTSGFILSNIINNQPAALFLSSVLTHPQMTIGPEALRASGYSLVAATSLGANLTIIGALAGLMWQRILKKKGLHVSYTDFLKKGIVITPLVFMITLGALYLSHMI